MTSTTHSLVAVVIAAKIQNPALALPLSFLSNFVLDMIPHWDFGLGWREKSKKKLFFEAAFDVSLSYLLVTLIHYYFLPQVNLFYIYAVVFASQLPDWLEVPYLMFNIKKEPFAFFYRIQHHIHHRWDLPWGILPQIAVTLPLLYLLLAK